MNIYWLLSLIAKGMDNEGSGLMGVVVNFNKKITLYEGNHVEDTVSLELKEKIEKSICEYYRIINDYSGPSQREKLFHFYRLLNHRAFGLVLVPKKNPSRWEHFKHFIGMR